MFKSNQQCYRWFSNFLKFNTVTCLEAPNIKDLAVIPPLMIMQTSACQQISNCAFCNQNPINICKFVKSDKSIQFNTANTIAGFTLFFVFAEITALGSTSI